MKNYLQPNIRNKTYRWERFMYQRDERLTGYPYKANMSKTDNSITVYLYYINILKLYRFNQTSNELQ
jgi:hypothetical protein